MQQGTELLDRFVQAPDRKGAVGKDRCKSGGASLRPEAPNEPGIERRTKWKPPLNGHTSRMYFKKGPKLGQYAERSAL